MALCHYVVGPRRPNFSAPEDPILLDPQIPRLEVNLTSPNFFGPTIPLQSHNPPTVPQSPTSSLAPQLQLIKLTISVTMFTVVLCMYTGQVSAHQLPGSSGQYVLSLPLPALGCLTEDCKVSVHTVGTYLEPGLGWAWGGGGGELLGVNFLACAVSLSPPNYSWICKWTNSI